jgi:hypothetical protein
MVPLLAAWLASSPAHAAEGLVWEWSAPRRYLLELEMVVPRPLLFQAENNYEVRVVAMNLQVDTTCVAETVRKTATDLRCSLDQLSMAAMPVSADAGRVPTVLEDIEGARQGAWIELSLAPDGQLKAIDLEGLSTKNVNERVRQLQETMRLVLVRAFAALDLELPRDGAIAEGAQWSQKGSEIVGFPSLAGTVGSVELQLAVARTAGTVTTISTKGAGIAGPGDVAVVGGAERVANQYDLVVSGWANFDTALHALTGRQYEVTGTITAGSLDAAVGAGNPYVQKVRLTLVKDGDPAPQLGPNAELGQP